MATWQNGEGRKTAPIPGEGLFWADYGAMLVKGQRLLKSLSCLHFGWRCQGWVWGGAVSHRAGNTSVCCRPLLMETDHIWPACLWMFALTLFFLIFGYLRWDILFLFYKRFCCSLFAFALEIELRASYTLGKLLFCGANSQAIYHTGIAKEHRDHFHNVNIIYKSGHVKRLYNWRWEYTH